MRLEPKKSCMFTVVFIYLLGIELLLANTFAARNSQIVFTTTRHGHDEIYVMDADGGNQKRLTRNKVHDWGADLVSRWAENCLRHHENTAKNPNLRNGFRRIKSGETDGRMA